MRAAGSSRLRISGRSDREAFWYAGWRACARRDAVPVISSRRAPFRDPHGEGASVTVLNARSQGGFYKSQLMARRKRRGA